MNAILLAIALIPAQLPEWPQLPTHKEATIALRACNDNKTQIDLRINLVVNQKLLDLKQENERATAIWFAVWWATYPTASPEQRTAWIKELVTKIGEKAFLTGQIPLPLGW